MRLIFVSACNIRSKKCVYFLYTITWGEFMKLPAVVLLFVILSTACTKADDIPQKDDFSVLLEIKDHVTKSNGIELVTGLINRSNHDIQILHASPLVQLKVLDEQDHVLFTSPFGRDDVGLSHTLVSKELYNPDRKMFVNEKRTVEFDRPGVYKLVAVAYFSANLTNGQQKSYEIASVPAKVTVE